MVAPISRIGPAGFLVEPFHALQDLRHDALHHARAFIAPGGNERFDFIDEDDAARFRRGGIEELLDVLLGFADPFAQDIGGGDAEKRGVDFAGGGLGEHRFPGAGRAVHQHAAAGANAEFLRQLRVLERIDHLQADVFLHVVEAGDIAEAQGRFFAHDPLLGGSFALRFAGGRSG